jgi:hypothetical protein
MSRDAKIVSKRKRRTCLLDNRPCDAKNDPRNIGDWISGACRHGGYSEEDNSQPECERMSPRERMLALGIKPKDDQEVSEEYMDSRFMDRKKKSAKSKSKRKPVKKCKCK